MINTDYDVSMLPDLLNLLKGGVLDQHRGIIGMRKIVSVADSPPIQELIDCGMVDECIRLIHAPYPQLRFEAVWTLTNIASGTSLQTQTVVNKGGINLLVNLITDPEEAVAIQAIYALGNITVDSTRYRD